jgi:hypothetical protein
MPLGHSLDIQEIYSSLGVRTTTRQQVERQRNLGSVCRKEKIVLLSSIMSRPPPVFNRTHIQWVFGAISQGIKRPENDTDHSPLSGAELKLA